MTSSHVDWPAADTPGLRIGDAAELMHITPKAIRVYHEYGLLPGIGGRARGRPASRNRRT